MKTFFFTLVGVIFTLLDTPVHAGDMGILKGVGSVDKIRNGEIHAEDIPGILQGAIDFLMGFAAAISILFIIIGAYQMAIGSVSDEKSKGKNTIFLALGGFVLASLSWIILKVLIDNFT